MVRGMRGAFVFMDLMVIGDLNFAGVCSFPLEDNAPLFVDADRMESGELTFQKLQMVAWGLAKVFERDGFIDGNEFVISALLNFPGDFARRC